MARPQMELRRTNANYSPWMEYDQNNAKTARAHRLDNENYHIMKNNPIFQWQWHRPKRLPQMGYFSPQQEKAQYKVQEIHYGRKSNWKPLYETLTQCRFLTLVDHDWLFSMLHVSNAHSWSVSHTWRGYISCGHSSSNCGIGLFL